MEVLPNDSMPREKGTEDIKLKKVGQPFGGPRPDVVWYSVTASPAMSAPRPARNVPPGT